MILIAILSYHYKCYEKGLQQTFKRKQKIQKIEPEADTTYKVSKFRNKKELNKKLWLKH